MRNKARFLFCLLFFLGETFFLTSEGLLNRRITEIDSGRILEIEALESKDLLFSEFSGVVEDNLLLRARGKAPDIYFFKHTISESDRSLIGTRDNPIIAIAARCNISYDTIATLNGIANASEGLYGKTILIPTISGIFIKTEGKKNHLDVLLYENYGGQSLTKDVYWYKIGDDTFAFFLDRRFSPTERAYFLDSELRLPLDKDSFWISSSFGGRINPFSGEWKNHNGIDFAAAEGTPVHAVKDGLASFCIKNDNVFGNYIILSHDGGNLTSVYAHLSKIGIEKGDNVRKGDVIGFVGKTGLATGPHLHFEIRNGGVPENPKEKLKL